MLYQRKTFTCPTANPKQSELLWDVAFLSDSEFSEKYGVSKSHYGG